MKVNNIDFSTYLETYPDENGYFGKYGGSFLPDSLKPAFEDIKNAYMKLRKDPNFMKELETIQKDFQGRPTPVYFCEHLTKYLNGAKIYLKREDLNHTGAHKLNHCMGEGLIAKYLGKKKMIAETGAGQHGVACATAASYFGLECEIHMGKVDIKKQSPNVARMKVLGAKIVEVEEGAQTLKEAVDSAFKSFANNYKDAIYCIGSALGPHPFPLMVRDFQKIVGNEAKKQFIEKTNTLPDVVCACVGGGSNSIGMFIPFLNDEKVKIVGIEPLGKGSTHGLHAASLTYGTEGIMHGFKSIMLKTENGEPDDVYSIASGLDYPSVGPEHAFLKESGRIEYDTINDDEALEAFFLLSRLEGIIPALESSHALAYAIKIAKTMDKNKTILVNLSGRGDKDLDYLLEKYDLHDLEKKYGSHIKR